MAKGGYEAANRIFAVQFFVVQWGEKERERERERGVVEGRWWGDFIFCSLPIDCR